MRALPLLVLAMGLLAGCVSPQIDDPPDPPPGDEDGDGLDIVAPGGGGETLAQRIDRISD